MNCKLALVFLVVLAAVLQSTQGKSIHDIKDDLKDIKKPLVAVKVGIAKSVGAKLKLAAVKKLAVIKTIVKAPFVLAKKAAVLKIGAIKSLAALKAAKAKKVIKLAGEKAAPAFEFVAGIPAAVAGIPSAALGKLKPKKPASQSEVVHQTEVLDNIYTFPNQGLHYQQAVQHQIPANTNYHYYKSGPDAPRTYSNDYGLVPENHSGSQYYPVSDIIQPHNSYGVPAN